MIFKPVSQLKTKQEKAYFLELVSVYIRLVECYCEKNKLEICENDGIKVVDEMMKLGVISNCNEILQLSSLLKEQYRTFLNCVKTSVIYHDKIKDRLVHLSNFDRFKMQKKTESENCKTLVDFFCGAGGLSLGFIQEGFHVELANDIEDVCIQTYIFNHPEVRSEKVIKGDIKEIIDNIEDFISRPIDIVVGGPPCQGFSEANRQRVIDDPRNELYKYFIQAVGKIAPKFVVMENVKGMLKVADQVVEDYEALSVIKNGKFYSYKVAYKVLNSSQFSVAQNRERLIYIAVRNDMLEKHNLTPERLFDEIESNTLSNPRFTLQDALNDLKKLEAPRQKNTNEIDDEFTGKKIDVNLYENNNNPYLELINMGRDIPFVYNHKARYVSDLNYEIYKRLQPGEDATSDSISDIMPYAHRNHCFKDKYFKLFPDKPCRTITAHLKMDCHSHIHPSQIRALTPREAARVQSFPDDYLFLGAYLKTYMQIGNAVPPMMARGIAKVIKKYL